VHFYYHLLNTCFENQEFLFPATDTCEVLFPIQLIIYFLKRRGKDESAGISHYLSKAAVKNQKLPACKIPALQILFFVEKNRGMTSKFTMESGEPSEL